MKLAVVALALALAVVSAAPNPDALSALDEKEVVRLFVSGTPTAQILAAIATREPKFDLSPEMLEELRLAGLPAALIDAMRRRQEAAPQAAVAPSLAAVPEPPARPLLKIQLDAKARRSFSSPAEIEPAQAKAWGLSAAERHIEGFAVYAACLTPTHVPDQWRSQSPLGRDFHSMPRHELLLLTALETTPKPDHSLHVELSEQVEIALEPGEPHDLSFGLAVGAAGRYFRLVSLEQPGFEPSAGPLSYTAKIGPGAGPLGFELNWVPAPLPVGPAG